MSRSSTSYTALKPRGKTYNVSDGGGLRLTIRPSGAKNWQIAYRIDDKQKCLSIGPFPAVTLAYARARRDEVKAMLGRGIAPRSRKGCGQHDTTHLFETQAEQWFAIESPNWSAKYAANTKSLIWQNMVKPMAGKTVEVITTEEVLDALQVVQDRGAIESAHKLLHHTTCILDRAKLTCGLGSNPASGLRRALKRIPKQVSHPFLPVADLGTFYIDMRSTDRGSPLTHLATELMMHTFLRSGSFLKARWEHIASDQWNVPGGDMKSDEDHVVPLSRQAKILLGRLREISGDGVRLFPGNTSGSTMSGETMNKFMDGMGYKKCLTTHGWRHCFSTAANESGLWECDWIEMQLGHSPVNQVRAAYNKAKYLRGRTRMMQWWSDQLEAVERQASEAAASEQDILAFIETGELR
jgi:integrase